MAAIDLAAAAIGLLALGFGFGWLVATLSDAQRSLDEKERKGRHQ